MNLPKYVQVAAGIRAQITAGTLKPGEPAPSGAALSRATGYSALTCRKALSVLVSEGVLVSGASRNARPRIPPPVPGAGELALAGAARALSGALAARRRAAGLTQLQFAGLAGVSVTTVGRRDRPPVARPRLLGTRRPGTRRGWELLALHGAYRAAAAPSGRAAAPAKTAAETAACARPALAVAISGPVACVNITWANGEVTTAYPPEATP